MVAALHEHARYPVPERVDQAVLDLAGRFGRVVITREEAGMLRCANFIVRQRIDETSFRVAAAAV